MLMKKVLIILFTILSISLAAGCSDDSSSSNTNSTNQEQNGGGGSNNGNTGQGENGNGGGSNNGNTGQGENGNGGGSNNGNTGQGENGNGGGSNNGNTGQGENGNGSDNGNGGESVDPVLKKLVDSIIGEYKVINVKEDNNPVYQPEIDTPFVKINSQDYKTLLIEYKIYMIDSYAHRKVFITDVKKFIDNYIKKNEKNYEFKLPMESEYFNYIAEIEKTKQYQANHGLGMQNKVITINVNNGSAATEDIPKNISVIVTSNNIKNPVLKIYEAFTSSADTAPYIFGVDKLDRDDVTNKFQIDETKVTSNIQYNVSAKEELPFPAYIFDITTNDNINTFGVLIINHPNIPAQ